MSSGGYPALSRRELAVLLGCLFIVFLFANGPVWRGPWDATPSIVISYLPIPFLIAGLLLWHRRWGVLPWALHTLELVFAKFMVTAIFLVVLWMVRGGPPPQPAPAPLAAQPKIAPRLPAPTPYAADELGTLTGTVVGAEGQGLAGRTVAVVGGLEKLAFAPRTDEAVLALGAEGYSPSVSIVQVGQPLVIASSGATLHTAQALDASGTALFNLPVPAKGPPARHVFYAAAGPVRIRCTVHGKAEREATLWVVGHPFWARTDEAGRFTLAGLPKQRVRLKVLDAAGEAQEATPGTDVTLKD